MPGQDVSYTVLARLAQPLPSNENQGIVSCSLASGIPARTTFSTPLPVLVWVVDMFSVGNPAGTSSRVRLSAVFSASQFFPSLQMLKYCFPLISTIPESRSEKPLMRTMTLSPNVVTSVQAPPLVELNTLLLSVTI